MNFPLIFQLLRTPPGKALVAREATKSIPKILANEPPDEDSKWQDQIEKERENQKDEQTERERGRGLSDDDKINRPKDLDDFEKSGSKIDEIMEKGPNNQIENTLKEGPNNQIEKINEKGTKSFQERLRDKRGWSPEDGAKLEIQEPVENEIDLTDQQKENFIQLAQMDNIEFSSPTFTIENDIVTFESEYETVDIDMDMDASDGGDGGDGGGDGGE